MASNYWDETRSIPALTNWTCPIEYNNEIYCSANTSNRFIKYNPSTDIWTILNNTNVDIDPRFAIVGDKAYVRNNKAGNLEDMMEYDITLDSWDKTAGSATTQWFAPVAIGTKIYVVSPSLSAPEKIFIYDTVTQLFDEISGASMTISWNIEDAPIVIGTDIYYIDSANELIRVYSTISNTFTSTIDISDSTGIIRNGAYRSSEGAFYFNDEDAVSDGNRPLIYKSGYMDLTTATNPSNVYEDNIFYNDALYAKGDDGSFWEYNPPLLTKNSYWEVTGLVPQPGTWYGTTSGVRSDDGENLWIGDSTTGCYNVRYNILNNTLDYATGIDLPQNVYGAVNPYEETTYGDVNIIYAIAGNGHVYTYNANTTSWSVITTISYSKLQDCFGLQYYDGKLYTIEDDATNSVWRVHIFDIASKLWISGATLTQSNNIITFEAGLAVVANDRIYCVNLDATTDNLKVYNIANNSWSSILIDNPYTVYTIGQCFDGKLYCKGYISPTTTTDKVFIYDISLATWDFLDGAVAPYNDWDTPLFLGRRMHARGTGSISNPNEIAIYSPDTNYNINDLNSTAISLDIASIVDHSYTGLTYELQYKETTASVWSSSVWAYRTKTFNFTVVNFDTLHDARVRVVNGTDIGVWFYDQFTSGKPYAIFDIDTTANVLDINATWDATDGTATYDVDYKLSTSGTWINAVTGTSNKFVDFTVSDLYSLHDIRIRGTGVHGTGDWWEATFYSGVDLTISNLQNLTDMLDVATSWDCDTPETFYDVDIKKQTDIDYESIAEQIADKFLNHSVLEYLTWYDIRVRGNHSLINDSPWDLDRAVPIPFYSNAYYPTLDSIYYETDSLGGYAIFQYYVSTQNLTQLSGHDNNYTIQGFASDLNYLFCKEGSSLLIYYAPSQDQFYDAINGNPGYSWNGATGDGHIGATYRTLFAVRDSDKQVVSYYQPTGTWALKGVYVSSAIKKGFSYNGKVYWISDDYPHIHVYDAGTNNVTISTAIAPVGTLTSHGSTIIGSKIYCDTSDVVYEYDILLDEWTTFSTYGADLGEYLAGSSADLYSFKIADREIVKYNNNFPEWEHDGTWEYGSFKSGFLSEIYSIVTGVVDLDVNVVWQSDNPSAVFDVEYKRKVDTLYTTVATETPSKDLDFVVLYYSTDYDIRIRAKESGEIGPWYYDVFSTEPNLVIYNINNLVNGINITTSWDNDDANNTFDIYYKENEDPGYINIATNYPTKSINYDVVEYEKLHDVRINARYFTYPYSWKNATNSIATRYQYNYQFGEYNGYFYGLNYSTGNIVQYNYITFVSRTLNSIGAGIQATSEIIINNKLYIITNGGLFYVLNLDTEIMEINGDSAFTTRPGAVSDGTDMYVLNASDQMIKYDISLGQFVSLASGPVGDYNIIAYYDGIIYCCEFLFAPGKLVTYDVIADTWNDTPGLTDPTNRCAGGYIYNNELYTIINGTSIGIYNFSSDTWDYSFPSPGTTVYGIYVGFVDGYFAVYCGSTFLREYSRTETINAGPYYYSQFTSGDSINNLLAVSNNLVIDVTWDGQEPTFVYDVEYKLSTDIIYTRTDTGIINEFTQFLVPFYNSLYDIRVRARDGEITYAWYNTQVSTGAQPEQEFDIMKDSYIIKEIKNFKELTTALIDNIEFNGMDVYTNDLTIEVITGSLYVTVKDGVEVKADGTMDSSNYVSLSPVGVNGFQNGLIQFDAEILNNLDTPFDVNTSQIEVFTFNPIDLYDNTIRIKTKIGYDFEILEESANPLITNPIIKFRSALDLVESMSNDYSFNYRIDSYGIITLYTNTLEDLSDAEHILKIGNDTSNLILDATTGTYKCTLVYSDPADLANNILLDPDLPITENYYADFVISGLTEDHKYKIEIDSDADDLEFTYNSKLNTLSVTELDFGQSGLLYEFIMPIGYTEINIRVIGFTSSSDVNITSIEVADYEYSDFEIESIFSPIQIISDASPIRTAINVLDYEQRDKSETIIPINSASPVKNAYHRLNELGYKHTESFSTGRNEIDYLKLGQGISSLTFPITLEFDTFVNLVTLNIYRNTLETDDCILATFIKNSTVSVFNQIILQSLYSFRIIYN